jgi:hypothetical protein
LALIPIYAWLLVAWTSYAIDLSPSGRLDRSGHIKGHDFVHFYVLGQIANDRAPGDLYSFDNQAVRTDRLVPDYEDRFLPVYGPQVSLLFAPFARLPFGVALTSWLVLSAGIHAFCCYRLWVKFPALRQYRSLFLVLTSAYPAFYWLIASGHISALAVGCITAGYVALRSRRPWLAGIALGSLFYKPSLGLALPFVLVYGREWRIVLGAVAAVSLQLIIACAYFGTDAVLRYFKVVARLGQVADLLEPSPYQMHSLRSIFSLLLPSSQWALAFYLLAGAMAIVVAAACWRRTAPLELRFSVLILATVLVDPHVNAYDLIVIAPVFILVTSWATGRGHTGGGLWVLLYLCYYLPALTLLPVMTHVQLSVVADTALLVLLARFVFSTDSARSQLGRHEAAL